MFAFATAPGRVPPMTPEAGRTRDPSEKPN